MNRKVVALFSGGIDSTTLLWYLGTGGYEITALSFNYGQRHAKELDAARRVLEVAPWPVRHRVVDLSAIRPLISRGALTGSEEVPCDPYDQRTMATTIVPNRNAIMLSIAVGHAIATGADAVAFAPHAGDHALYPDCCPAFVWSFENMARLATGSDLAVLAPFVGMTKADIIAGGVRLGAPLVRTWSCYQGRDLHCGTCGTCRERRESFRLARVDDPTEYAP